MLTRQFPGCVEFRDPTPNGTRVIRVNLETPTPRVSCFVERHRQDICGVAPMSIYFDELEGLVKQAIKINQGGA